MADFNIRTDAVDVEQIMRQIRARIQEKRGVDYTEQQIQELANVKLERFLDPKGVRSDLVEQFRRARDRKLEPFHLHPEPSHGFDAEMLYGTHRGILRLIRRLLNPILKLFFNPNTVIHALHKQTEINALYEGQFYFLREKIQQRDEIDVLYYELVHNLVLELTRIGIENRSLKMRLESLSSRMDFDERRARALEGVVQYRAGTGPAREVGQPQTRVLRSACALTAGTRAKLLRHSLALEPTIRVPSRAQHAGGAGGGAAAAADVAICPAKSPRQGPRSICRRPRTSATPPHGDPTAHAALESDHSESDLDPDSDSSEDEGPDPSAQ